MSIILSGVVFSAIDPQALAHQMGYESISALGCYTLGFFFFWGTCAWSGFFSIFFSKRR